MTGQVSTLGTTIQAYGQTREGEVNMIAETDNRWDEIALPISHFYAEQDTPFNPLEAHRDCLV